MFCFLNFKLNLESLGFQNHIQFIEGKVTVDFHSWIIRILQEAEEVAFREYTKYSLWLLEVQRRYNLNILPESILRLAKVKYEKAKKHYQLVVNTRCECMLSMVM
jgi:hypothetical protein